MDASRLCPGAMSCSTTFTLLAPSSWHIEMDIRWLSRCRHRDESRKDEEKDRAHLSTSDDGAPHMNMRALRFLGNLGSDKSGARQVQDLPNAQERRWDLPDLEQRTYKPRQPGRPDVVTYVVGTFCYLRVEDIHSRRCSGRRDLNSRPLGGEPRTRGTEKLGDGWQDKLVNVRHKRLAIARHY